MHSIAVVGIGNNLLQDDGAGIHALQHFEKHHADASVCCLDAGTVGLALMDRLTKLHGLVAVDAMRLGKPPGTVTVFEGEEMDRHLRNHHGSVHELGLSDILDALRLCGDLPACRALVGIEPEHMDWGTEPTQKVAAAIPYATARIRDLVLDWRQHCTPGAVLTLKTPIRSPLPFSRGNVRPLLNEIVYALDRLLGDDEPTVIDLASLPFAPGELEELEQTLGDGELTAELDALGKSFIRETGYPGVWWVEHHNTGGEVVGRHIEITRNPEILMSQDADIGAGRARLRDSFESSGPKSNEEAG